MKQAIHINLISKQSWESVLLTSLLAVIWSFLWWENQRTLLF